MYANEASVRTLCINVRSGLDSAFILEHGETVDAMIDAKLGEAYYWPTDSSGNAVNNPPPTLIVKIANKLTAAAIERTKYAVNEANGQIQGNPYAASLEREGKKILEDLVNGDMILPELAEVRPIRQSASPPSFTPVRGSGFSGRRGR